MPQRLSVFYVRREWFAPDVSLPWGDLKPRRQDRIPQSGSESSSSPQSSSLSVSFTSSTPSSSFVSTSPSFRWLLLLLVLRLLLFFFC